MRTIVGVICATAVVVAACAGERGGCGPFDYGARIDGFDVATGEPRWGREIAWEDGEQFGASDDERIYLGRRQELSAFDGAGSEVWANRGVQPRRGLVADGSGRLVAAIPRRQIAGVDGATGRVLWTRNASDPVARRLAITGSTVIIATGTTAVGIDTATGLDRWRIGGAVREPGGKLLVAGGKLFRVDGAGQVHAHDALTGEELWATTGDRQFTLTAPVYSGPDATVLEMRLRGEGSSGGRPLDSAAVVVDPASGRELWTTPPSGERRTGAVVVAGVLLMSPGDGPVTGYELRTGRVLWSLEDAVPRPTTVVAGERRGYAMGRRSTPVWDLIAVASGTGHLQWKQSLDADLVEGAFVQDGVLILGLRHSDDPNGDRNGEVVAIDGVTGETLWTHDLRDEPLVGPLLIEDTAVVISADTAFYCL